MSAFTPAVAPPPGPPFVSQLDAETFSIIGPEVTLTQANLPYQTPANGVDVTATSDVFIYADTVNLAGRLYNPGRKLQIVARVVTVATAGAALDVSGVVGAPNYAPGDLPIQKDTSYGADGQPGDHGGAGAAGGSIGLYAAALTGPDGAGAAGPLTLNAAGGAGGRGQDGGSGQPGASGRIGVTPPWAKGDTRCAGSGFSGGNGGPGGDGRDGGAGGSATVGLLSGADASSMQINVGGGAAGPGGAEGIYAIGGQSVPPPRSGGGGLLYGGPSGNYGLPGAPGQAGPAGSSTIAADFTPAALGSLAILPQLGMLQQHADSAFLASDYVTAAGVYDLLSGMTASASPTSTSSDEQARAAICQASLCELSRLRQGLDFYGDQPDWAPALTLTLLQNEITAMLTLVTQLEASLDTLVDAEAAAGAKRNALQAAQAQATESLKATQTHIGALTAQLKTFETSLALQAAAIDGQMQTITLLQRQMEWDQFAHDHPGCTALTALNAANAIVSAGTSLFSSVSDVLDAGKALFGAGSLMEAVKNGVTLVTTVKSTFEDLMDGYNGVKDAIDPQSHPDAGKVITSEADYDAFLDQYTNTYLASDASELKAAVHRYFALIKTRNLNVLAFNALYLTRQRLQAEFDQQSAQFEVVSGQLAAQSDPTNQTYIAYLQAADAQLRLYLMRKIDEERHAFLYWSVDNDDAGGPAPTDPTDSSLPTLQAAHAAISEGIDGWQEAVGRPFEGYDGIQVAFTRADNPDAFAALETTKQLVVSCDMTSAGDAFDYMTHVTTSVARVCLPDYDDTQTSGELVANVIHGGGGAFLQMDGETTAQFSHAIRPALYRYDYARKAVVAPATFGDASQGYTGLSPFTDWIIDFNFTQGGANSFIEFSKLTQVVLEFDGQFLGPDLQSEVAALLV